MEQYVQIGVNAWLLIYIYVVVAKKKTDSYEVLNIFSPKSSKTP